MGKSVPEIAATVADGAFPLSVKNVKNVVDRISKNAEWLLIGEASHGTRDFHDLRAGV